MRIVAAAVGRGMAYDEALQKLRSGNPTPNPTRWEQAKRDASRFVEKRRDKAAAFGWCDEELFGLHPTAPLARYDVMGLLWMLQGREIVDLTAEWANFGATKRRRSMR